MMLHGKLVLNKKLIYMLVISLLIVPLSATVTHAASENQPIEDKPADEIGIMGEWTINWDMAPQEQAYGQNRFTLVKGDKISYDFSWSPQPGVISIGLYNHNTDNYYWAASSTKPPLKGKITVPSKGLYSIALRNNTDTDVYITGSYQH